MMDANLDQSWRRQGLLYPTMLIAAIAVIIFSMIGIAAMTGLLPSAMSGYRKADDAPAPALKRQPQDNPRALDAPRGARDAAAETPRAAAPGARAAAVCTECGVVESIRALEHKGEGSVAGASAGNDTERMNTRITYQVRVRMDDGSHRNHYQGIEPKVGVGQHIRLSNGRLVAD